MASRDSNGTGGGDWTNTATWADSIVPVDGDAVTILSGDVVTYDRDDAGSAGSDSIDIDGELILQDGNECVTDTIAGSTGLLTGTGGFEITFLNTSLMTLSGLQIDLVATSGNIGTWTIGGTAGHTMNPSAGGKVFKFHYVDIIGTSTGEFNVYGARTGGLWDIFECLFDNAGGSGVNMLQDRARVTFGACYFTGSAIGLEVSKTTYVRLLNPSFGKNRAGGSDPNTVGIHIKGIQAQIWIFNPVFDNTTDFTYNADGYEVYMQNSGVLGDWERHSRSGIALKSVASKDAGDHGIEFIPNANLSPVGEEPWYFFIPIPCESGDDFSSWTFRFKIDGGQVGGTFSGATGDIIFTLDPGDEWGLEEEQEPVYTVGGSGTGEEAFQTITFAGGTAGGTAKKGSIILMVRMQKYVASIVHYLADLKKIT